MARFVLCVRTTVAVVLLILARGQTGGAQQAQRSVIDDEYGQYYGFGPVPSDVGLAVLQPHSDYFAGMTADSIKGPHGHFHHFAPHDPGDDFPYDDLRAYEASEVAAGRPPIFVTATYNGQRRPVYFEWHLGLDSSGRPTAPPSEWSQAVNVRDDRFIRFYAQSYLRKRLWTPPHQNYWHGVDNSSFRYNNYGVLDDNGVYHNTITWDQPFAQSDSDFLDSIKYFLSRVKQLAPDVHIIANEGSMNDETRFADVWGGFDGTLREDINASFAGDSYNRNEMYKVYKRYKIEASFGQVALLRALVPFQSDPAFTDMLRTSYVTYLIFRGRNFFFGPRFGEGSTEGLSPDTYAQMRNDLGQPTNDAQDAVNPDYQDPGFRLYWRYCDGGIVYLNWSGVDQTISLRSDRQFVDRSGQPITALTVPDLRGDYARFAPGSRAERPAINPRWPGLVSGPVPVVLSTRSATSIHYTLNGTEPGLASPLYTGPLLLTGNTTVKAKAFCDGCLESFVGASSYTITSAPPAVQFYTGSDTGSRFLRVNAPLVTLSHPSATTVHVAYSVTGGTAVGGGVDYTLANGVLVFNPGEVSHSIVIDISGRAGSEGRTIDLALSNPSGASPGSPLAYRYTISGTASVPPPGRFDGAPTGTLPASTQSVAASLHTDETANCRLAATPGVNYNQMTTVFTTTDHIVHATQMSVQPGGTYALYVRCRSTAGPVNADDYLIAFNEADVTGGFVPIRVRSGGPAYTDHQAQVWAADFGYYGGSAASTTSTISGTADPALYQTQRRGSQAYEFVVPNGQYTVTLRFAEIEFDTEGARVFDISINGDTVLPWFDVLAAAGGPRRAVDRIFSVAVTNGELVVILQGEIDLGMVSAIEIR